MSAELQPEEAPRVALVDLRLVGLAGVHLLHGRYGVADEARPLFGIERKIGAEQHVIRAKEGEAALHRVPGSEQCGVAVEHAEVVDGPPREPSERGSVARVIAPRAELIESAADPALAERDHRAQVMRDDDESGVAIEEAPEDQPPYGHA